MTAAEKRRELELAIWLLEQNARTHERAAQRWRRRAAQRREELHVLNLTDALAATEVRP